MFMFQLNLSKGGKIGVSFGFGFDFYVLLGFLFTCFILREVLGAHQN